MDESLAELNRLASAASASDARESSSLPTEVQLGRWQQLFHYTRREAFSLVKAQRSDLTRTRITDEHWELVQVERERIGHDRETYEHSLSLGDVVKSQSASVVGEDGVVRWIFRLGGLLGSVEKVGEVAGLSEDPKVVERQSESGVARFCAVDEEAKVKIEEWLVQAQLGGVEGK